MSRSKIFDSARFAHDVQAARWQKDITVYRLSKITGLSYSAVWNAENNRQQRSLFVGTAICLCKALGLNVYDYLEAEPIATGQHD